MLRRLTFWRFCTRLALHMAPGYIATVPARLAGAKITVRASVEIPLHRGESQRLSGTFREIVAHARLLA